MRFEDHPRHVRVLLEAALRSADPAEALRRSWRDNGSAARSLLIGAGKASVAMIREALAQSPDAQGIAAVVPEHAVGLSDDRVRVMPADHPLATARNTDAARAVWDLACVAGKGDTLIVLLSGGASAHLTWPVDGLTLDDLRAVTDRMLRSGAPIEDLNCVRKHCERLKGGRLAEAASPARVATYVLSDVIGDRLDVIGSGPTVSDPTTYADALDVLDRHGARDASERVTAHLEAGARGERPETPKSLPGSSPVVIASNDVAVDGVAEAARSLGFRIAGIDRGVVGDAAEAGRALARRIAQLDDARPACWVMGGETTVDVRSGEDAGLGGPSQELALAAAIELEGVDHACVVAFATDGLDGPTDSAGAWATGTTVAVAAARGLDAGRSLARHDSQRFFSEVGGEISTGPTGTNVNDIALLLAYP
jgi:glycerate 2-kinase